MRCANMRKPRTSIIIAPQQLSLSPATLGTHLVAGVPLLKVGVGPSNGAELTLCRCTAVPLYLAVPRCSDSIITSPEIHYISHNLHLHPTPLDYLEPRTSQSVRSPLLILLQATPICPHLTLLLSLHIPLDFETNQSIVTSHHTQDCSL
jgi:hypothetical protein